MKLFALLASAPGWATLLASTVSTWRKDLIIPPKRQRKIILGGALWSPKGQVSNGITFVWDPKSKTIAEPYYAKRILFNSPSFPAFQRKRFHYQRSPCHWSGTRIYSPISFLEDVHTLTIAMDWLGWPRPYGFWTGSSRPSKSRMSMSDWLSSISWITLYEDV